MMVAIVPQLLLKSNKNNIVVVNIFQFGSLLHLIIGELNIRKGNSVQKSIHTLQG